MANDVKVVITLKSAPASLGFGYPLIFGYDADAAEVGYTECSTLSEVAAAVTIDSPIYKAATLMFGQDSVPEKVAVMRSTSPAVAALTGVVSKGWRQLVVASLGKAGESTIDDIAAFIEAAGNKMFFCNVSTVADLSGLSGKSYDRTVVMFYKDTSVAYPAAALVGATAGKSVGSFTYKNMVLKGVAPDDLTVEEVDAAHAAGALCFVTKAGDSVTSEGKTVGGEYIDIVDSKDWIIQQIEYAGQKVLNTNDKVPYDNKGIALLEATVAGVLKTAFNNGMIAEKDDGAPDYKTTFATRSEVNPADRAERKYLGGKFEFGLAGAVHTARIEGSIVV